MEEVKVQTQKMNPTDEGDDNDDLSSPKNKPVIHTFSDVVT
jgi:hypothetical protein